ncbi:alpha-2,8-sialyltransferase 8F [Talpa occidentalis]|uniref:alpha-2,8-sialyltransferase 8F n=1 Tax=Talpa occidentalis TaxID=50954 RepID=UPI00188DFB6C|nr:alpha-2,8-sialyltransferase 8F [Talpa occidentalis]
MATSESQTHNLAAKRLLEYLIPIDFNNGGLASFPPKSHKLTVSAELFLLTIYIKGQDRLLVEEGKEATHGTPAALRTLRSPATPLWRTWSSTYLNEKSLQWKETCKNLQGDFETLSNKTKRYSENDYLQIITNIQNCPWKRQSEEYENFRTKLASCCDAVQNFVVSQNNTPVGTNISYEVESKYEILIRQNIFNMFPVSQPFMEYPYNQCAVVGNGGILNKSLCGAEIDKSDFVFRCNLPPVTGNISKDVGSKTNLVTINPSIIKLKYGNLKEKRTIFLKDIANYGDAYLLLPAFSFRANTIASFRVYETLKVFQARPRVIFFHPKYLKNLALFWRTKGVTEYRLSSGLMITSVAVELCENVKLYGFWPFSKTVEDTPVSHHYYDNNLPKRGFHEMPKEYSQILQLHLKGILKLQFSKCETA